MDGRQADDGHRSELESLLAVQKLARSVVQAFFRADGDEVDEAVQDALGRLGRALGLDRSYVFRCHVADGTFVASNTHEWCGPGVEPQIEMLQAIPFDAFGFWEVGLRAGRPVVIDDVGGLPAGREAERAFLEAQGIRSLAVVPMRLGGELDGFVGFDSVAASRHFGAGEVEVLRSVADALEASLVRRDAAREVARAEERILALTRYATDLIAVVDDAGIVRFISPSWELYGLDADAVGKRWEEVFRGVDIPVVREVLRSWSASVRAEPASLGDIRVVDSGGQVRWLSGTVADLRDDPRIGGFVVNAQEITQRKLAEEQLAHDALHDALTTLGNRTMFVDRLELACHRSARSGEMLAVLFLDLDRFKLVNDGHGHEIGDQVLRTIGERLPRAVRRTDAVARFGGDEFLVLIEAIDPTDVASVTQSIRDAISEPISVGPATYRVTASIGAAVAGGADLDPETLIRDADTAMYRAKERGRDRVEFFDPALHAMVRRRMELVHRLPEALDRNLIAVHYQPIVDLVEGRTVGAEALVRWHDSELGWVPPEEFVRVAEEIGVAVNLSPAQLDDPGLVSGVRERLDDALIDPTRLTLEVTESMLLPDPRRATRMLARLRDLGVRIALDDFGTGYSSLGVLRDLPVDVLKIDRSFTRGVAVEARDRRLVTSVISLAQDLGMTPLAEGVETEQQRVALLAEGCTYGQGFLFSHPLTAQAFAARVAPALRGPDSPSDQDGP